MAKKRGLGRGLAALIPSDSTDDWETKTKETPGLISLSVDEIHPNPMQPRTDIGEDQLTELAASITEHGIIQPIIVSQTDDGYQMIAGERRWRAARIAGLEEIPAVVKEVTSQERLEIALVENLQRADLNPLEEASAYRQLMDEFGLSQDQVAERVGKSRSAVANTVRLLLLPSEIRDALVDNLLTEGHARALLPLPTEDSQVAAMRTVTKRQLNVRQTEEMVRRMLGETTKRRKQTLPPEYEHVQEELRQALGTKVTLTKGRKGGRVIIHYYSDEELDELVNRVKRF